MANLVQVAEELEYVPKDQLIQMSQNPESRYPQYLVLSEIQRRTQMEKRYNAEEASMNRPQTTVAEEVVADFAQPQGLAGMNAEGAANAGAFLPEAMPETPMQMAAGGGRTGYERGGATREAYLSSLGIDITGMSEQEIQEKLLFLKNKPVVTRDIQTIDTDFDNKSESGGIGDWLSERYFDEDDEFKPGRAALDASMVIPAFGAAGWGLRGAKLAANAAKAKWASGAIQQGVRNVPSRIRQWISPFRSPLTTRPNPKVVQGEGFSMRGANVPARVPSLTRITGAGAGVAAANLAYNYMDQDQIDESVTTDANITKSLKDDVTPILSDINKGKGKGLSSFLDQAEGLDIAQLGGVIMGARNMSELGAGIAGLAGSIQDRRTKEKLTEIQGNLYEAQTAKYRADVEFMKPNQLIELLGSLEDRIELEMESGTPEDAAYYRNQYNTVLDRYYSVTGDKRAPSQADINASTLDKQKI